MYLHCPLALDNPQRSSATPPVCLLERYSASTQIQGTSFNQRFLRFPGGMQHVQ
nr:MAG TPA: hypothetical protein [Caudoviricetes sp.]